MEVSISIGKIVLFLFVLTFGKNPQAARDFAQLKGEWTVVRGEEHGLKLPMNSLPQTVRFVSSFKNSEQPASSIAFSGALQSGHTPGVAILSTVFIAPEDRQSPGKAGKRAAKYPPIKEETQAYALYRITGNTMKLLIRQRKPTESALPTSFAIAPEDEAIVLELRRKTLKLSKRKVSSP